MWRLLVALSSVAALFVRTLADSECPLAPDVPTDKRSDTDRLRVMQFNAEWLFIDPYGNCPGSGCPWPDTDSAWTHLRSIASVIAELNPDIVNFCEVQGCDELNDVIDELGPSYNYTSYLKKGDDTATGQNVGIISRVDPAESLWRTSEKVAYPLADSTCGAAYSGTKGCSKHYFTSFEVNGMKIAMAGAHLLAYPDDPERCAQREAQATVVRNVIEDYLENGYEVIVIGDLNDFENNPKDVNDNTAISKVLDILKGTGTDKELVNVASLLSKSDRYTDWWDEDENCIYEDDEVSMIDHILLSPNLVAHVEQVFVAHDAFVQSCDTTYSDHWPVVVDFNFGSKSSNNDDDSTETLSKTNIWLIAGAGMFVFIGFIAFAGHKYLVLRKHRGTDNKRSYAEMQD